MFLAALIAFATWLIGFVLYPIKWANHQITAWLVDIVNAVSLPSWWTSATSLWSGVPEYVRFFAGWFNLSLGLSIILAAYLIRFMIRRLPIIG